MNFNKNISHQVTKTQRKNEMNLCVFESLWQATMFENLNSSMELKNG